MAAPSPTDCLDESLAHERTLYTLDGAGNRVLERLEVWNGSAFETRAETQYEHASRCRLEKVIQAPGSPEESTTEYDYDCNGNLTEVWDGNHPRATHPVAPQRYAYDALNRLVNATQTWGPGGSDAVTSYGYDVQDHLTSALDAEGNTTTYAYSDRDLLTEEVSPVSATTSYTYNEHGELATEIDALGTQAARTIDALDRVTSIDYPATALDTAYTYDAPGSFMKGRLRTLQRPGHTLTFNYDRFGRTTGDGPLAYQYDANGNRTRLTYPFGIRAVATYDFADRPATLLLQPGFEPAQPIVTAAGYEPFGPSSGVTLGNGLVESRGFDRRYAPTGIAVGTLLDWDYTSDEVGNVTTIADVLNPGNSRTFAHQDVQYYLTQGTGPWGSLSWDYDRIGNRLHETRGVTTDTYSYTGNGSGNSPTLASIALGAGGTRSYTYDAAGSLTRIVEGASRLRSTPDAERRVQRLDPQASFPKTTLKYDGRGYLRSSLFEPDATIDQTTLPLYGSEGLLYGTSSSQVGGTPPAPHQRFVLHFAGRPVAIYEGDGATAPLTNTQLTYLSTDHLGTAVLATDSAGAQLWQGGFEPFGKDYGAAQAAGVFLRFPGQWQDESWENASFSTGLYYNVHRWYEWGTGRYNRPDPLGLRGGLFLYVYAAGRPLTLVDPLGLKVMKCCRNIEVNQGINLVANTFGLQHCFIKTDTMEAGMGPANNGPLPACPLGVQTAVVDHTGQSSQPGTTCREIPNVDEECVNKQLQPGRRTGRWTPFNQCNGFVDDVLGNCRVCTPPPQLPTEEYPPCAGFGCPQNR